MKQLFKDIFYSFPVQLVILHFKKYQVLLLFWVVLISTINSGLMKDYGADALFFSPEYLGSVNFLGTLITGAAFGVFVMSWNVTTFILHTKRFKFLATTTNPFLKYCINNAVIPLLFMFFYFIRLYRFNEYRELMNFGEIMLLILGIILGFLIVLFFSFVYFFGAEKTIVRNMAPIISNPDLFNKRFTGAHKPLDEFGLKVSFYVSGRLRLRQARNVNHYRQDFIDTIFKNHHLAAITSILLAFVFLIVVGFLLENRYFDVPASASILIFFAIMTSLIGAMTYFLQSWSLVFAFVLVFFLNYSYKIGLIDPRNKAYGIDYTKKDESPAYNKQSLRVLCSKENIDTDKATMIGILENWKKKQQTDKPVMFFLNVSGGGLRSAVFVMNALQKLDSMTSGKLMKQTVLISGASGGMLAAAYYRELYREKQKSPGLNISQEQFTENMAKDLLNPIFSSMIARDLFTPVQKFKVGDFEYLKDRGYAFEKKLAENTEGLLDKQLKDLAADERNAIVPMIIFNAVIKSDGRKLMMGTQPLRFMMKPSWQYHDRSANPDAVDFSSLFANQKPQNLRMLTALRMNATFPYVLPNVWLPSKPVIDVMDAGLRDNYGLETSLRFIDVFRDWIDANTGGVVILQLRDRLNDNWQQPYETKSLTDMIVNPVTMLQHNWYKLQEYYQHDQFSYLEKGNGSVPVMKYAIMYKPEQVDKGAVLNFHLTAREKRDVKLAFESSTNKKVIQQIESILKH